MALRKYFRSQYDEDLCFEMSPFHKLLFFFFFVCVCVCRKHIPEVINSMSSRGRMWVLHHHPLIVLGHTSWFRC